MTHRFIGWYSRSLPAWTVTAIILAGILHIIERTYWPGVSVSVMNAMLTAVHNDPWTAAVYAISGLTILQLARVFHLLARRWTEQHE